MAELPANSAGVEVDRSLSTRVRVMLPLPLPEALDYLPPDAHEQAKIEPVYETLAGWRESTRGARSWAELPATAIKYIRRVEELIGAPVALLSTSPEREDTILVRDPFVDR